MHRYLSNQNIKRGEHGMGLIEIVIGSAIVTLVLLSLVVTFTFYVQSGLQNTKKVQAAYLLEEGIEAVRFLRDNSYAVNIVGLDKDTPLYLAFNGTTWSTTTASLIDGVFTRTVTISDVYRRDSDLDIVASTSPDAKTLDPKARKVVVAVSWGAGSGGKIISYEEGTTDGDLAGFPGVNGDPAQSFTTNTSGLSVGSVEFLLKRVGSPSNVFAEIREGSTTGTILGTSDTVVASTLSNSVLEWVTFSFSSAVELLESTQYFIRLRSVPDSTDPFSGASGIIHLGYKQTAPSPYLGGDAWRYVGRNGVPTDNGQVLTQYDYSFRVVPAGAENSISAVTYFTDLFNN